MPISEGSEDLGMEDLEVDDTLKCLYALDVLWALFLSFSLLVTVNLIYKQYKHFKFFSKSDVDAENV